MVLRHSGGSRRMKIVSDRWTAWLRCAAGLFALAVLLSSAAPILAQDQAQPASEAPPHQVELLLDLLRDPAVQRWLEQQPTVDAAAQAEQPALAHQPSAGG